MDVAYSIPERLLRQSLSCGAMGSAMYETMLRSAAAQYERSASELAAHLPSTGGDGDADAAWRVSVAIIEREYERVAKLIERTPQTNEVARSMPLSAACLAAAARAQVPLRLFEVGSSAGLNLRLDRYHYRGMNCSWGDPSSRLQLQNRQKSGSPAHLGATAQIIERRGCDLHPLDAGNDADQRELLSFVWPDQLERFGRLRAALTIAREMPVKIEAADGIEWIGGIAPQIGALTVIMHSVITEHMSSDACNELQSTIAALGARATATAPVAWIRMEPGERRYDTRLTSWPGGEECAIARSDGHAQDIAWMAAP